MYPFTGVVVGLAIVRVWTKSALSDVAVLIPHLKPGTELRMFAPSDEYRDWTYIVPKKPRRRFKCT